MNKSVTLQSSLYNLNQLEDNVFFTQINIQNVYEDRYWIEGEEKREDGI